MTRGTRLFAAYLTAGAMGTACVVVHETVSRATLHGLCEIVGLLCLTVALWSTAMLNERQEGKGDWPWAFGVTFSNVVMVGCIFSFWTERGMPAIGAAFAFVFLVLIGLPQLARRQTLSRRSE